jgi:hypothetical protein
VPNDEERFTVLRERLIRLPHPAPLIRPRTLGSIGLLLTLCFALFAPALAQTPTPEVVDLTLGSSTQGRPINAVRIGSGSRKLVLVSATHGYPERNTYELAQQLIAHFRANPRAVPPELRLYIVPLHNPDGLALGRRQNANGVDLNRNMDTSADTCPENDWSQRVAGAYGIVSDTGGPYSDSEVESRVLRDFLLDADGVILFHSNAGVVFPACNHEPSITMARIFAEGAGYAFIPRWDLYAITGGIHDWAGGLGIAAITPELVTGDQPELAQNLGGVEAVLRSANEILPQPQPQSVGGFAVQPIIWRAWRAWGGEPLFGLPLGPPVQSADGWTQLFERASFAYKPSQSDSTAVVQLDLLGRQLLAPAEIRAEAPQPDARFFPETQQNVSGLFADFWQINGGLPVFGLPLSAAEQTTDDSGALIVQQLFERALLQRPLDASSVLDVRLAPLGRMRWAQQDAQSIESSIRAR